MEKFKIITEISPWFYTLCLLAGLGYAFLLYSKKGPWGPKTEKILFAFRFIVVTILGFLLTGPLMRMVKNHTEKPAIVFAIDNSESVKLAEDSIKLEALKANINNLAESLTRQNLSVEVQLLSDSRANDEVSGIRFTEKTTNLDHMLSSIKDNYESRNLSGVVLMTDGIYNQGLDPLYDEYSFPVFSLALGDTTVKKDLNLKNLLYNKIAYAGNKFPLITEIYNTGYKNEKVKVLVKKGSKVLDEKLVNLSGKTVLETEFTLTSEKPGLQHYTVEVTPLEGEATTRNNTSHAYIEVINGKEKILTVALSPHPDIKALKSAIEQKENYEFVLHIPGVNEFKQDKYDLVIFHQFPDIFNSNPTLVNKLLSENNAHFFILGSQSSISRFNQANPVLEIKQNGNQKDQVTASVNHIFEKFRIEPEEKAAIASYPPVVVPFGNFISKGKSDIILYQKVGTVTTENPLLVTTVENNKKYAVFAGEGLWQWRLNEYRENGNSKVFDKLFSSLVQYLSAKEDKRKFRLYPVSNEFNESENVLFEAEVYNDVYEKVYNKEINLSIINEAGKKFNYSFKNSEDNSRFEVKGLKPGLYSYNGNVTQGGKTYTAQGDFLIKEIMLEAINTTANHGMLKELSSKTNGQFYTLNQFNELSEALKNSEKKSIIHSSEEFQEFINLPWLFFLIILLITAEWGVRKYSGGY